MSKLDNLLALASMAMGAFDKKINRAFMRAQQMPRASTFHNYSKPNQRRKRKEMRRTVFANRRIARG
ncbi:MAG: hypothetical protein CVU62_13295 [Deltaproteobacteria bacterium HGW-Deltaproteobacteria-2]|jgi:hypothetical protein|nr:MAG: hypothetical protein CVU62_13295 [Deltaproteobacteria bacterium HGW-Deltaproteobacteria-2]